MSFLQPKEGDSGLASFAKAAVTDPSTQSYQDNTAAGMSPMKALLMTQAAPKPKASAQMGQIQNIMDAIRKRNSTVPGNGIEGNMDENLQPDDESNGND
jgi:hypothetical protein